MTNQQDENEWSAVIVTVSAEVADCVFGRPAEGVRVTLQRDVGGVWCEHASARTDAAGRVIELEPAIRRGRYRVVFDLDEYFAGLGVDNFQSEVGVVFRVAYVDECVNFLLLIAPSISTVCRVASGR